MDDDDREYIREARDRIAALLDGRTVDGKRLGDPGLDREWCRATVRNLGNLLGIADPPAVEDLVGSLGGLQDA